MKGCERSKKTITRMNIPNAPLFRIKFNILLVKNSSHGLDCCVIVGGVICGKPPNLTHRDCEFNVVT